jgi:hypothetical protein
MIRVVAFSVAVGIVFQMLSAPLHYLEFLANKSFIASVLCEKKSIPDNGCQGKCQLKKQLKEDKEREAERPQQSSKSGIDWQVMACAGISFNQYSSSITEYMALSMTDRITGYPAGIFHPPCIG